MNTSNSHNASYAILKPARGGKSVFVDIAGRCFMAELINEYQKPSLFELEGK
jgi:hypothetical protein